MYDASFSIYPIITIPSFYFQPVFLNSDSFSLSNLCPFEPIKSNQIIIITIIQYMSE